MIIENLAVNEKTQLDFLVGGLLPTGSIQTNIADYHFFYRDKRMF